MLDSILATFAYFGVAAVLLLAGFVVLDLLTPGKLYRAVFVDHHVNAAVIASAHQIALGAVLVTAIVHSFDLLETAVYGLVGIVLQALALVILEALIPGRFRDLVEDTKPRAGTFCASVILIVIGAINAACLT